MFLLIYRNNDLLLLMNKIWYLENVWRKNLPLHLSLPHLVLLTPIHSHPLILKSCSFMLSHIYHITLLLSLFHSFVQSSSNVSLTLTHVHIHFWSITVIVAHYHLLTLHIIRKEQKQHASYHQSHSRLLRDF